MKINLTLIIILLLLTIGLRGRSQASAQYVKSSTASGSKIVRYPEYTIANTLANSGVEKSMLPSPDTIFANTVTVGSQYRFSLQVNVTTPLLNLGTMTIKLKMGSSVLTIASAVSVNALNSTTPIYIEGEIEVKAMNSQIVNARLIQWNGNAINIGTGTMTPQSNWTNDMTTQQLFDITATFTGVTVGTTSYTSRIFRRYIEQ